MRAGCARDSDGGLRYGTALVTIAALYVDRLGPYPKIPGVDCWDLTRDARKYRGPDPIVAHPACGPWGKLRHMYKGGEGGPDLAIKALRQVRTFGGVLEHPADSLLWWYDTALIECLGRFGAHVDEFGGYCLAIEQVEWGHVARKRTWLYLVNVPREALESAPFPGRAPTHWISGGRNIPGKRASQCAAAGVKIASGQQRRRTPPYLQSILCA